MVRVTKKVPASATQVIVEISANLKSVLGILGQELHATVARVARRQEYASFVQQVFMVRVVTFESAQFLTTTGTECFWNVMVRVNATTPLGDASVWNDFTFQIAHVSSALCRSVASFAMEKAGVTQLLAYATATTIHRFH